MAGGSGAAEQEARLLELLWRPRDADGRPGISTARIVTAGIALADAEGADAVSMRRVAAQLGSAAMSLYTHVPDKAALVALMSDEVLLGMAVTEPAFGAGWRERLRLVAGDNRDLLTRHPWLLRLQPSPPPLGPGLLAKYEWELSAFHGLGLSATERDSCLTLVLQFVRAATAEAIAARMRAAVREAEGERWSATVGPVLARYVDEDEYPLATRIGAEAGAVAERLGDPDGAHGFGLERVLDGVAALVARSRT
ncbi:MAG: TetR/AcrR family transcriptional regulator C-terminal domain-containing protein [Micrococcales bacterium]|nr:TetR/AcrR family transcriptional regulator C-terminal domain-containing protein [Micrococcales bacterium]